MELATTERREATGEDLPHPDYDRWRSIPEAFFEVARRQPEAPFLWAWQGGAWRSWSRVEVETAVRALARGLRGLGIQRGDRVVLVAENRPEFLIADLAIMAAGAITVPAYTTNTRADHDHILDDSGATLAIVSTADLAERLLPAAARAPACRAVILIDGAADAPEGGPTLHAWQKVLDDGAARSEDIDAEVGRLNRDDTACFIYTSGTGGAPKGVVLSHGNVLANCKMAFALLIPLGLDDEIFLSFLPLSHSYEHTAGQCFPVTIGAQIYYSRGVEHLTAELTEVRPTVMTAVPRLYESMHQRILRGVEKGPKARRFLFRKTLDLGRKRYRDPAALNLAERLLDAVLERLVRDKVRARFGGRLKGMVSGGAALDPDIAGFFTALGLRILQGYGQTETSPIVSCNPPNKVKLHTVGPPLPAVEARIAEDGELLVRGPMVMQGYWNLPTQTAAAIKDGWLHTGDIATIDADGYIQITDRKKDIIVMSGGDTLSPAKVERALTHQSEIAQAMVQGDRRPHLVAVLVPDGEWLERWAARHGKQGDLAALAGDPDLRTALDEVIARSNRELAQIEKVRRFIVASEPFTVDNDMMTPTLKVRRHKVREVYGDQLDALYGNR